MKKIILFTLALCILLGTVSLFSGCSSMGAPKTEDIYDRVVELVEASYELNTVFYGMGLPVYATDSVYADFSHLYYGFAYSGSYEMVKEHTKFQTVEDIKSAAEQVYSTDYLETVLYPAAFEGYAIDDGIGGSAFSYSRFLEENEWLYQSTSDDNYLDGIRIYDYSTMKVVSPSKKDACFVEMSSWLDHSPDVVTTVRLRFVLQDDGLWYLDSFTG